MKVKGIILASLVLAICFGSCTNSGNTNSELTTVDELANSKEKDMKSYISMFEIPATDISRAINFYQALLGITIEKMDVEGMQMGILPYEGQMVTGVIIQAEGYKPSADGVTVYLNAGENLQIVLDRVEKNGGQILVPKTAHAMRVGTLQFSLTRKETRWRLTLQTNGELNLTNHKKTCPLRTGFFISKHTKLYLRGNNSSLLAASHAKAAVITALCFRSASIVLSYTSILVWCVRVRYSIGSCIN
jgi:predicted enzyme related to lactoylglutathione lyase